MTAAYGARARIGLILPADNVVIEPEYSELALDGISFHGLRLTATDPEQMRGQAVELADAIALMGLDAAVYACAETSFNGGEDARQSLPSLISKRCGLPVVTATNATLEAVAAVGLSYATVITPYTPRSGDLFERTLTIAGCEVAASSHRDFRDAGSDEREWFYTNRVAADTAMAMAMKADVEAAQGIVIGSTNWPTLQTISKLEQAAGKPVITSNQAILWWCKNTLGLDIDAPALGRLFTPVPASV